jgi:hypothetical protein
MFVSIHRLATLLLVALLLAACGAGTDASTPSEPSAAASEAESAPASIAPSAAAASEGGIASVCLEAEIFDALEQYQHGEVPADPSVDEVADALEALELEARADEFRDGVVEALRGETGETLDEFKVHDAMFSLIPLQSEVNLTEC